MREDKAICVFAGQNVTTDAHANPGAPTVNPNVMVLPYDNRNAAWDPELTRPAGAFCTENAISRATALQRAQLKMLENPRYEHPGFWSPFLLINNWL